MKIVHVMNWYIPNMGYQENFLPAEQKKLGHDVEIITSDRMPPYVGFDNHIGRLIGDRIIGEGEFEENGVKIYRLPTFLEIEDGGELVLSGLPALIKKIKPDIVQSHGITSPSTLQVIYYSKKLGYSVFVDDHLNKDNFILNGIPKKIFFFVLLFFYKIYGHRVHTWLPITHASKELLLSEFHINKKKINILPLGADSDLFYHSDSLRIQGREELKITGNTFLIVTAGKLDPTKDIETLIQAFSIVQKRHPNSKLLIIGNGAEEYVNRIKQMIIYHKIQDNVINIDFTEHQKLAIFYNAADVGVWPGTATITVVEAMATGLPVIIPRSDKSYQHIFENNAAFPFNKGAIEELSQNIITLIENKEFYNKIKKNAINLITTKMSWKKIAQRSISIFMENSK